MNSFRDERKEFIYKYFMKYHEMLVNAISSSKPDYYSNEDSGFISEINSIQIMKKDKIIRKLNYMKRTDIHHRWEYSYNDGQALISDWASMNWDMERGLYIHFEWISIQPRNENENHIELEMDEAAWAFLFSKRKIIFDKFPSKFSEPPEKHEDFILLLTDSQLNELPIYKVI